MDTLTPEARSKLMSRIRGRDTAPEKAIRRMLTGLGFRYRLNVGRLPGRPDVVIPRLRRIVFVHGCFWHFHQDCRRCCLPKSNERFWMDKLEGNRNRDRRNVQRLRADGWKVATIWACEIGTGKAEKRLSRLLERDTSRLPRLPITNVDR